MSSAASPQAAGAADSGPPLKKGGARGDSRGESHRRRWLAAAIAAVLILGFDLGRPPQAQLSARVLIAAIDAYQATLSKLMPVAGVKCRFQPTCSHYAEGSVRKYGALKGTGKAIWRLLRCAPWSKQGTIDPP